MTTMWVKAHLCTSRNRTKKGIRREDSDFHKRVQHDGLSCSWTRPSNGYSNRTRSAALHVFIGISSESLELSGNKPSQRGRRSFWISRNWSRSNDFQLQTHDLSRLRLPILDPCRKSLFPCLLRLVHWLARTITRESRLISFSDNFIREKNGPK